MQKYTLITGASSGIGLELAKISAADGRNLLLTARNGDKLKQLESRLRKKHGVAVHSLPIDLSKPDSAQKLFDWAKKHGNIEILINNAGFGDYGEIKDADWTKLEGMINLNVLALTALTRLVLPGMLKQKSGKIMNVASVAAFLPGPLMSTYYATKAYVKSFSMGVAEELRDTGITVTTLCPGATETNFVSAADLDNSKLFDGKSATAHQVAKFGYDSLLKVKGLVIYGVNNRLLVFGLRLLPTATAARLAKKAQAPK